MRNFRLLTVFSSHFFLIISEKIAFHLYNNHNKSLVCKRKKLWELVCEIMLTGDCLFVLCRILMRSKGILLLRQCSIMWYEVHLSGLFIIPCKLLFSTSQAPKWRQSKYKRSREQLSIRFNEPKPWNTPIIHLVNNPNSPST